MAAEAAGASGAGSHRTGSNSLAPRRYRLEEHDRAMGLPLAPPPRSSLRLTRKKTLFGGESVRSQGETVNSEFDQKQKKRNKKVKELLVLMVGGGSKAMATLTVRGKWDK